VVRADHGEKFAPSWAVLFSVSFDGDAIRDDYVKFFNDSHMEKVQNRAPRMVWRERTQLHLMKLSSLLVIEPEKVTSEWREGSRPRTGTSTIRMRTPAYTEPSPVCSTASISTRWSATRSGETGPIRLL
jgi:hypothetical protein